MDVATTLAHTTPCESVTAMAVSSQEDSIERTSEPASVIAASQAASRGPQAMGQGRIEAAGSTRSSVCSASALRGRSALRMRAS